MNSLFVTTVSFSPWTVCLWPQCHHSVHEQPVCDCSGIQSMTCLTTVSFSPWTVCLWLQCHHSIHELSVYDRSVIQCIKSYDCCIGQSMNSLWLNCHSVQEQSVISVSCGPRTVCDIGVIQSMNSLWCQCHYSVREQSVTAVQCDLLTVHLQYRVRLNWHTFWSHWTLEDTHGKHFNYKTVLCVRSFGNMTWHDMTWHDLPIDIFMWHLL
jgi:hypothetical protein